jgi:hypothetical protein
MKAKGIYLEVFLLVLMGLVSAQEQSAGQDVQSISVQTPAALSILFNRAVASLRGGRFLTGLIVGLDGDSLVMRVGKKDEKIPLNDLAKVDIETDKRTAGPTITGMVSGLYLGNFILGHAKGQPNWYMKDIDLDWRFFLANLMFAGFGGGAGYLARSIFEKGEIAFDFSGDEPRKAHEREKLKRFILGISEESSQKVHLSLQAAHVYSRVSDGSMSLFRNAGFDVYTGYGSGSYFETYGSPSHFNLLRKIQITYSFRPNMEAGAAVVFLGEPAVEGEKNEFYSDGNSYNYSYHFITQKLAGEGYYLIGCYKPFLSMLPKKVLWTLGLGAGAASVNFNLSAQDLKESGYPNYNYSQAFYNEGFSKYLMSGIIFTDLFFRLPGGLSLGFAADYVFVPSHHAPAIPEVGIPAQKLKLASGSLGFFLGMHF